MAPRWSGASPARCVFRMRGSGGKKGDFGERLFFYIFFETGKIYPRQRHEGRQGAYERTRTWQKLALVWGGLVALKLRLHSSLASPPGCGVGGSRILLTHPDDVLRVDVGVGAGAGVKAYSPPTPRFEHDRRGVAIVSHPRPRHRAIANAQGAAPRSSAGALRSPTPSIRRGALPAAARRHHHRAARSSTRPSLGTPTVCPCAGRAVGAHDDQTLGRTLGHAREPVRAHLGPGAQHAVGSTLAYTTATVPRRWQQSGIDQWGKTLGKAFGSDDAGRD